MKATEKLCGAYLASTHSLMSSFVSLLVRCPKKPFCPLRNWIVFEIYLSIFSDQCRKTILSPLNCHGACPRPAVHGRGHLLLNARPPSHCLLCASPTWTGVRCSRSAGYSEKGSVSLSTLLFIVKVLAALGPLCFQVISECLSISTKKGLIFNNQNSVLKLFQK